MADTRVAMEKELTDKSEPTRCPHCGAKMKKWANPEDSTWGEGFHFVCFNDECSYFVRGWKWMTEKYNVRSSYRHCFNPKTGKKGPLPVWSYDALKGSIIEDESDE
ncbi:ogr/Delta-like zinc finger family protein [Acidobacteriota bacterium]